MKELLAQIKQWRKEKKSFNIARVIQTWGSSPRPVGSTMLISSDLEIAGSVSGGCVEGVVLKESEKITHGGRILDFGVSDEDAWTVGLTCGGELKVYLQPWFSGDMSDTVCALETHVNSDKSCILITELTNGTNINALVSSEGELLSGTMEQVILEKAKEVLGRRKNEVATVNNTEYFFQVFPKRSRLIIVGAAHITADLIFLAKEFDFETIVIDPRGTFIEKTTFQERPDQVLEKYPSEVLQDLQLDMYTYVVILSHDPKIDDDALQMVLRSSVAYIGVLGSKGNHKRRTARLKAKGFTEVEISKINAPIGVDINAKGAKEIALSIMGAIIQAKNKYL